MKDDDGKQYKCVNCGAPATALYKTYGPSVLKLTKCKICKELVDKYIEYDPVIVMIDILLMSKEAQRHVLYNTEFKAYWKLLIVLVMLETYGIWRHDSLFSVVINTMCGFQNHNTTDITNFEIPIKLPQIPDTWKDKCWAWDQDEKANDSDLFIWEKDFYVQFSSTFIGIIVFLIVVKLLMMLATPGTRTNEVSLPRLLKGFSLGYASVSLALPMAVWHGDADAVCRALHYAVGTLYGLALSTSVFTVLYECPMTTSSIVLIIANCAKYVTSFHVTPFLRTLIS